jgi:CheY-like chemotaxis protein
MMKRILVIDDDEGIRKLFLLSLEGKGFQIDTAESGEKSIELMQQTKYDLIYLDLKMPGMNGVETLRELRKMNKDVPVYIITAFHEEYFDQLKAVEQDGIDFELLKKPFDSEQLILVTKGILEGPERY